MPDIGHKMASLNEILGNQLTDLLKADHSSPFKPKQLEEDVRLRPTDDQSRVIMKFEEKRLLLQAICDRKEALFGPNAAKMKPAQKQALWEEVIDTFRQNCPDSTAELSSGYVRGIFWQNLRKRTLAKKERAMTDENVKFDELDELVAQILGDKMSTPPASVTHSEAPTTLSYQNISDILLPVLKDTFYNYQLNNSTDTHENSGSPAPTLNNVNLDYSKLTPHNNNNEERAPKRPFEFDMPSSSEEPPELKRARISSPQNVLAEARLSNITAETEKIKAETRLLELKYVLECKKNNLRPERLADGRFAFVITDNDTKLGEENSQSPVSSDNLEIDEH
ncbi:unnamed protein product [Bursaphelenchus okinawaensis]|uniref:Regulatory protein zeste n=1 Tax=Bursaphelenchus okinawaensis TaxID=465554 RepID=A0A811L5S3_9BILA|nr:unnamed protein product [Bursaphelenchus okinawaensis]CAG9117220.1 unnamed protein product [Bursaphelenchus okinawaensis]